MKRLTLIFSSLLLLTWHTASQASRFEFTAPINAFEGDQVIFHDIAAMPMVSEHSSYKVRSRHGLTKCYNEQSRAFDCQVLKNVGYVTRARMTVKDNYIESITVLEMQQ